MKKLVLVGLVLVGCGGGVDFRGTYSGVMTASASCSDGSAGTNSAPVTMEITEVGPDLLVNQGGDCAPMTAKHNGDAATINPKSCTTQFSSATVSGSEDISLQGGTLTKRANKLSFTMHAVETFYASGYDPVACNVAYTGDLTD